jgi:cytoskeletal protein CcmA (bactofilin family)
MWNRQTPENDASTPQASTPSTPRMHSPDDRRAVAWVGKSVVFKGELTSSEDMTIDGRVEGTIDVRDHALTIGPDADIRANVTARVVKITGKVAGTVIAKDVVDLSETASVEGDIFSPRLAIAEGATLQGRVDTSNSQPSAASRPRLKSVV